MQPFLHTLLPHLLILLAFLSPYDLSIPQPGSPVTEQMVKTAERARYEAITAIDTTALDSLLADEFMYHQPTGEVASKQTYLDQITSGSPLFLSADFNELMINIYDDVAVSRGTVSVSVQISEEKTDADLRFLNVWIYRNGRLQLAARQSAFR